MASPDSEMQTTRYWQDGFLNGLKVVDPDEAKAHREQLEEAERRIGYGLHYHSKVHTVLRSPYELATHPTLLDLVEEILGPNILLSLIHI